MVQGKEPKRVAVLLLAENTPPGRNKRCGLTAAGFHFCGTAGHLPVEGARAGKTRSYYTQNGYFNRNCGRRFRRFYRKSHGGV